MPTTTSPQTRRRPAATATPGIDCPVCYGPCDQEIHRATLSIRAYLREELARKLFEQKTVPIGVRRSAGRTEAQQFTSRPVAMRHPTKNRYGSQKGMAT